MGLRYILLITHLFLFFISNSQNQIDTTIDLELIEIKASKLDLVRDQMSQQISIINQEQIQMLPAKSFDEIFRYIPGLELNARGLFGSQSDIAGRGSTYNQVLVLVDGIRINDPLTGHFSNYIPVTLAETERIEIIRGSSSALYGSEAVGLTINIVTKAFDAVELQETRAEVLLGQHSLKHLEANHYTGKQKWNFSVSGRYSNSDGHTPQGDSIPYDFDIKNFSMAAAYQFSDKIQAAARIAYDDRDFGARYYYTQSPFDLSLENVRRWLGHLNIFFRHRDNSTTIFKTAYTNTIDSFLFNPAFRGNHQLMQQWQFQINHRLFLNNWRFLIGADWISQSMESFDRGDRSRHQQGLYALAYYNIHQNLELNGGLRIEFDKVFQSELNPQFGLNYNFHPQQHLRLYLGKSIRVADFTERYVSTNLPGILSEGRNLGNPNLEAERSWTFEIGLDGRLFSSFSYSATFYRRDAENLIDYILTPGSSINTSNNVDPGFNYFYAQNIAQLGIIGLDINLSYSTEVKTSHHLNLQTGLLINRIDEETATVSKYVANQAKLLLKSTIQYQQPFFDISAHAIYKNRESDLADAIGRKLAKDYTVSDVKFSIHPPSWVVRFNCILHNIANTHYADILGAELPGRWIMAGVEFTLDN